MTPKTAISILLIMGITIAAVFVYLLNNKELKFTNKQAEKTIVENNKAADTGETGAVDNKEERKSLEEFKAGSKEYIQEVQVRKTELEELKQVNNNINTAGTTTPAPVLNEEEALKALQRLKELNK